MKSDYYEYCIAGHYLPALINADSSGLDEEDIAVIDVFEAAAIERANDAGWHYWHWDVDLNAAPGFAFCDASGKIADCVTVRLMCFGSVADAIAADHKS